MAAAAACALAPSRPHTATFAPAPARAVAMSLPMPRLPPVTRATLPVTVTFTPPHVERGTRKSERGTLPRCSAFHVPTSAFPSLPSVQKLGDLVGASQRHHVRPADDAFEQTGQHVPRPDLHEPGGVAGELGGVLHALDPPHRPG